ncbi:MAG: hydrogenase maturation nickel metallochaperone HypA [Elusimicrobia bacterium]|nr:hydrogenase maturation nickel metallochaperone HypA [Elusimicrobiota bacterium]
MHESVKAKEIENKIIEKARLKNIEGISRVVIKIGKGEGESREDIEHIIKEHMKLDSFEIIEEDIILVCADCKKTYRDIDAVRCAACGSIRMEILSGIGVEVIDVA